MKKLLLVSSIAVFSSQVFGEILSFGGNQIKQISAYDDYHGGIVRIEFNNSHTSCAAGGYLNPEKTGFEKMYSLALVAASTQKQVIFQIYSDQVVAGLCEIDAIRVNF